MICMINCIVIAIRKNNRFSNPVVNVILAAISAMLFYTIHLVTEDQVQSLLLKGLYYANLDWILYFTVRYVYIYTDSNLKSERVRLMSILLFFFSAVDTMGELYCWKSVHLVPFYFHVVLCYCMIIYACFLLAYKAWRVSRVYRRKYLTILLLFSFINSYQAFFILVIFLLFWIEADSEIVYISLSSISFIYSSCKKI